MLLDLEPVEVSSLFVNSLSIVREKAAARHIRLEHGGRRRTSGSIHGGRAQGQADRLQPALERGEVHGRRRPGDAARRRVPRARRRPARRAPWAGRELPARATTSSPSSSRSASPTTASASPPEGLEHLFKPFSQIDSGLARKFEGTGLGLAMVKLLAELHGGTVAVESAVGEGSCFTVWLPLRDGATTARPSRAAPAPVAVRRRAPPPRTRAPRWWSRTTQVGRADPRAARGGGLHGAARRVRRGGAACSRRSSRWR